MNTEKRCWSPSFAGEPHLQSIITHQPSTTTINTANTTDDLETPASRHTSRDELTSPRINAESLNRHFNPPSTKHRPVSSVGTGTNWRWSAISRDNGTVTTNRSRWSTSTHGGENNRGSMAITALPSLFFSPVPNLGLTPIPLPPKEPSIYDENVEGLARNWKPGKKWRTTFFVAWLAFISPLASSMVAPAVSLIKDEFKYEGQDYDTFLVSVFIFGYVVWTTPTTDGKWLRLTTCYSLVPSSRRPLVMSLAGRS